MKVIIKITIIALLLLTTGCQMQAAKKNQPSQAKPSEKPVQINSDLAAQAKEAAKSVKGVEHSTAVVIDKNISTGIKVSGFDRLRLKSIKEDVHKKVKALSKEYKVHVTTDKKLFKELQDIEKQINSKEVKSPSELKIKVDEINKDMNG